MILMKKLAAVLIGAGDRGTNAYAPYALKHPDELSFVAVAEPHQERREHFAQMHGIPEEMRFTSWEALFGGPKMGDAAFICTKEQCHSGPTLAAMEKGYHILLEKPIDMSMNSCLDIATRAQNYDKTFMLCYVLRYAPFYMEMKRLLEEGAVGDIVTIQHLEGVGVMHFAHSFIRGNWRREEESGPIILSKSCHDFDLVCWLAEGECETVSSVGSLRQFIPENRPYGAPDRCTDGCPARECCMFYAPRVYSREHSGYASAVISPLDPSMEGKLQALKEGPYGRCVYACDNNVCDHQLTQLSFRNGINVSFTLSAYTPAFSRETVITGTKGLLRGIPETSTIERTDFLSGNCTSYVINAVEDRHNGGDYNIVADFIRCAGGSGEGRTSVKHAAQSHILAFAAEEARKKGKTVRVDELISARQ